MRQTRRQLRLAELRVALGTKAEAIAVQVIAIRDGKSDFDRAAIGRTRREAERLFRLEQIGRCGGVPADEQREEKEECFQALVSAATQSR